MNQSSTAEKNPPYINHQSLSDIWSNEILIWMQPQLAVTVRTMTVLCVLYSSPWYAFCDITIQKHQTRVSDGHASCVRLLYKHHMNNATITRWWLISFFYYLKSIYYIVHKGYNAQDCYFLLLHRHFVTYLVGDDPHVKNRFEWMNRRNDSGSCFLQGSMLGRRWTIRRSHKLAFRKDCFKLKLGLHAATRTSVKIICAVASISTPDMLWELNPARSSRFATQHRNSLENCSCQLGVSCHGSCVPLSTPLVRTFKQWSAFTWPAAWSDSFHLHH